MLQSIIFIVWCFIGGIILGASGIPSPPDTEYGKEHPIEAYTAMLLMAAFWPLALFNRRKFARRGERKTWLSQ